MQPTVVQHCTPSLCASETFALEARGIHFAASFVLGFCFRFSVTSSIT